MADNWDPCIQDIGTVANGVGDALTVASASEGNAAASAAAAADSAQSAQQNALATVADRQATGQDRQATAADRQAVATDKAAVHADRLSADADAQSTAADRQAVAIDKAAVHADRLAADADAQSTAADRQAVATDKAAVHADRLATEAAAAAAQTWNPASYVSKTGGDYTGKVGVSPGSAGSPGLAVTGDPDTGIAQLGGADTLSAVAGGAEIWRISTSYVWVGGAPGSESLRIALLPGAVAAVTVSGTTPGGMSVVSTTAGALSVTSANGMVRVHGQRAVHLTLTGADAGGVATVGSSGGDLNLTSATGVVRLNGAPMGGGLFAGTVAKSVNYTVVASDARYLIECTASLTLSLTAAATLGSGFTFAAWNSGTGAVVIDPSGSELINGGATLTLLAGQWAFITCTGTAWKALTQTAQSSCVLSPTDKESGLIVTNGGLTASVAAGGVMQSGRATVALSGQKYFEIALDVKASSGSSAFVGIATAAAAFGSPFGLATSAGGYAYADDTGNLLNNGSEGAWGSSWNAAGVVIGVAFDDVSTPGVVKIWFSRNGVWQASGNPATGANPAFSISSAVFYPAITCKNGGQVTARFTAAAWTYSAPAGFTQIS